MDALECLFDRRTAKTLIEPAPTADQLDTNLRAATMAPDHKLVRPWRFVVVRGAARTQFGDALGWKGIPWTTHPALTAVFGMHAGEEVLGWVELGTTPPDASWRVPPPVPLESVVSELGSEGLSTFPAAARTRTDA